MPKTNRIPFRLLSVLAILPLAFLFGVAIFGLIRSTPDFIQGYQIRHHDKTTEGTVLKKTSDRANYTRNTRSSEKAYDTAEVSYSVSGQAYTSLHAVYTPKPGEHITLFYDPSNPHNTVTEAEVLLVKAYWIPVAIISALGIILIPVLIYNKFKLRRIKAKRSNQ